MNVFQTSLLREKFIIHDPKTSKFVTAMSNRMDILLTGPMGSNAERYVIRTQNMHSCVRMTTRLMHNYDTGGPLLNRPVPFDWGGAWNAAISDYEYATNEARWVAIYNQGKVIYEDAMHHPFLDVIEKCDAQNSGDYEDAIPLAETAFKKTGKLVKIEYDGNVALVVNFEARSARCAVVLRGAARTTTFNFTVLPKNKQALLYPQCLAVAASFLEGLQLSFVIGMNKEKIRIGHITRGSAEEKLHKQSIQRLSHLSAEITNLEDVCTVRYRPEKPNFKKAITEAEQLARTILQPGGNDWVY